MAEPAPLPELLKPLPLSDNPVVAMALHNIHAAYPLVDATNVNGTITYGSSNPERYVAAMHYFITSAELWWKNYDAAFKETIPTRDLGVTASVHMRLDHQQNVRSMQRERGRIISSLMEFLEKNGSGTFRSASGDVYHGKHIDGITGVELVRDLFVAVGKVHGIEVMPGLGVAL
jgi:hypothetical protein